MRFCENCGAEDPSDAEACPRCGYVARAQPAAASAPTPRHRQPEPYFPPPVQPRPGSGAYAPPPVAPHAAQDPVDLSTISESWHLLADRPARFLSYWGVMLALMLVAVPVSFALVFIWLIPLFYGGKSLAANTIGVAGFLGLLALYVLLMGYAYLVQMRWILAQIDDEPIGGKEVLLECLRRPGDWLAGLLFLLAMTVVSYTIILMPFAFGYGSAALFAVAEGLGAAEAHRRGTAQWQHFLGWLLMLLGQLGLVLARYLALGVGVFVSIPVGYVALGVAYRRQFPRQAPIPGSPAAALAVTPGY